MMTKLFSKIRVLALALVLGLICSSSAFASATIIIENADAAGVGFNDTTPVAPIGGNAGTTLGQQRLNAFQFAASIWGATLTSGPTITVRARWMALPCTANTATLGSAGATSLWRNFTNAPFANTWYAPALANALLGSDINGSTAEIQAQFNLNLGTTGCLENRPWYYGLDNNHGPNRINLVTVLLHEFAHGLGFASFTDEEDGTQPQGIPGAYDRFLLDNTTGKTWPQMTDAERVASAINDGNLVWNGPQVLADAALLTSGKDSSGRPKLFAPNPVDSGSSVSHWDRSASPNQLMEPNISTNLTHSVTTPQDLTFSMLRDIGWCAGCAPPTPPPAPANDNFAAAQTINGCSGNVAGTNTGATRETNEPRHSPDNNVGGGSVWYQWQAPANGVVTITTAGSGYDTLLAVYTGTSVNNLSVVLQTDGTPAKNDDVDPNHVDTTSGVTFNATAGTVYRIAVDGWGGSRGNIILNWSQSNCSQAPPPAVLTEQATSRAVAVDSVTQVKGPFPITGFFNFSADRYTRVMIFTSSLGTASAVDLAVHINGLPMVIETFGTVPGVNQASYITVKLTDLLPGGTLPLTVTVRGVTSNTATIDIVK
jgi:hypothetical protein